MAQENLGRRLALAPTTVRSLPARRIAEAHLQLPTPSAGALDPARPQGTERHTTRGDLGEIGIQTTTDAD